MADPALLVVEVDDGAGEIDRDVEVGRGRRPPWWLAVAAALVVAAALSQQHRDSAAPCGNRANLTNGLGITFTP